MYQERLNGLAMIHINIKPEELNVLAKKHKRKFQFGQ